MTDQEKLMMRRDTFLNRMNSPLIFVNDLNKLANVFYDVIYSYGLDTASSKILSKAKLIELLSIIVSDNAKFSDITASAGCDVLEDIKNYIDANLNSDISLDGIEKQFHYSKFYMEKKFNERFGMPIIKYCKIMKLEYSKSILSEKTVNETADFLSFGSVYSFIRSFKRAFGVSPGQYKKSLKLAELSKAEKHE